MKKSLMLAAMALALAGCQTSQTEPPKRPKLLSQINSPERLAECSRDYGAQSQSMPLCWQGSKLTRREVCAEGSDLLDSPYLSDWRKAQLYETMQNFGCMG